MVDGLVAGPGEQLFVSEDAAVDAAEDHRRAAAHREDAAEPLALGFPEIQAQHHEAEALSEVAEHDAENEGVGERHEQARIELAIARDAIHFDIRLVDVREPVFLELDRGRGLLDLLRLCKEAGKASDGFAVRDELLGVRLGNPADEVELPVPSARVGADFKGVVLVAQPRIGEQQLFRLVPADRGTGLVELGAVGGRAGGLGLQSLEDLLRGVVDVALDVDVDAFKAEGREDRLNLGRGVRQAEIRAVHPVTNRAGSDEIDVRPAVDDRHAFLISLGREPPEMKLEVAHGEKVGEIDLEVDEVAELFLRRRVVFNDGVFELAFALQVFIARGKPVEIAGRLKKLPLLALEVAVVRRHAEAAHEGQRLRQRFGIGVRRVKGDELLDAGEQLDRVFRVEFLVDDKVLYCGVDHFFGSRNGYHGHFFHRHRLIPPFSRPQALIRQGSSGRGRS